MPLPFNKTLDLKLVNSVKENPVIYNPKHEKYLDFDTREVVWQKIGDSLNRPAQLCKTRWINIRDMMRRKIRDRMRNPNRTSHRYKYEEEMSFMLPYFKEPNTYTEEYQDLLESTDNCDIGVPAAEFVNSEEDFVTHEREIKPNLTYKTRQEDNNCSFTNDTYQELNPADPLDVFLITIGATLRKFSPYHLNQAKSKIFQVVQDYELEQIMNKD